MLYRLRNIRSLSVLAYLFLLMEIMVPHTHQIGALVYSEPHMEASPHIELPQPTSYFHVLSQVIRDFDLQPYLQPEGILLSFVCYNECVVQYIEYPDPRTLSPVVLYSSLRAPPYSIKYL